MLTVSYISVHLLFLGVPFDKEKFTVLPRTNLTIYPLYFVIISGNYLSLFSDISIIFVQLQYACSYSLQDFQNLSVCFTYHTSQFHEYLDSKFWS